MADFTLDPDVVLGLLGGSGGSSAGPRTWTGYGSQGQGTYYLDGPGGTPGTYIGPTQANTTLPPGTDPRDVNSDGLDDRSGNALGVYSVPTSISQTGYAYGPSGIPVLPNGAPWQGGSQVPGYSNLVKAPDGIYGLNDRTGRFELIPGSETLGTPAAIQSGPVGGGGGGSSAYSGVAQQILSNQGALARIDAESQAQAARDAQQAQLRMQELAAQQGFTGQQNALSRALQAAQYASTHGLNRAQLQLQEKDYRRGLTSDFQNAVSSTDPSAYAALYLASGGNIGNIGDASAVSDRSLYGAAQILGQLRQPFMEIPDFVWTENGPMPVTAGGVGTGASGSAASGSSGVTGGGAPSGGAQVGNPMPFVAPEVDMAAILDGLRSTGATDADIAQLQADFATGKRSVEDFMLSGYYKAQTGNPNFIRQNVDGTQGLQGPMAQGSGYMPSTWQITDPLGGNYNPALIPTPVQGPAFVDAPPQTFPVSSIPGYATGTQRGLARGLHIVGDPPPGSESPNPEMIRWTPMGNEIVPLRDMRQARGLMRGGMDAYALGTLTRSSRDPYGVSTTSLPSTTPTVTQSVSTPIPYSQPVQQPVGSVAPQPTATQTPVPPPVSPTQPAPTPVDPLGQPTLPSAVTPEDQALMDEVRQLREGVDYPALNIYDTSYFGLDPVVRDVYERGRQAEKGIPQASTQFEANKFRMRGLSRNQFAMAV